MYHEKTGTNTITTITAVKYRKHPSCCRLGSFFTFIVVKLVSTSNNRFHASSWCVEKALTLIKQLTTTVLAIYLLFASLPNNSLRSAGSLWPSVFPRLFKWTWNLALSEQTPSLPWMHAPMRSHGSGMDTFCRSRLDPSCVSFPSGGVAVEILFIY